MVKGFRAACDNDSSRVDPQVVRWVGVGVFVVALLIRGGICVRGWDQFSADPDAYRAIAETLGHTGVYGLTNESGEAVPTAFRPPLYPWLLSWFLVDQNLPHACLAALHALLGAFTAFFTFRSCIAMLCDRPHGAPVINRRCLAGAIFAASVVTVDPILLQQSTLLMTETIATAFVSCVLWWWSREIDPIPSLRSGLILGFLLSLAFLCRPTFLVWAALLCARLAIGNERGSPPIKVTLAAGFIVAIAVGAWSVRNVRAVGHPVWATTHGGYTLLLGNNPFFYEFLRNGEAGTTWDAEPFLIAYSHRYDGDPKTAAFWQQPWSQIRLVQSDKVRSEATEHSDDQLAYDSAIGVITRQPLTFVYSCGVRLYRLWKPFPYQTVGRSSWKVIMIGFYYSFFYVAVIVGLWKLGWRILGVRWWPILALCLTLSLVHAVYWSNIRMRAPAIPALALLIAAAITMPSGGRSGNACGKEEKRV